MQDSIPSSNCATNFCTTIKIDGMQFDVWTNGVHSIGISGDHTHTGYELQTALSGQYSVMFADRQLQLGAPGTLCLIPPGCSHRCCDAEENARQLALDFSLRRKPEKSAPLASAAELLPVDTPLLLAEEAPLCSALLLFFQELERPGLASGLFLELLLQQILILLLRALKERSNTRDDLPTPEYDLQNTRYNKIEAFLHRRYADPVTENDLAQELAVSRRQTSRIMRQYCGKSFREKLEEIRMHYALQYLLQTDISAERIAFLVGYGSASGFFVAFKKRFSVTPMEYRCRERTGTWENKNL